ncbi:MAG: hypothetical protein U9R41_03305 [Candidatus Marinimicrobia bacterium]|nr:hypothetical protein [Candidatus Neomarinimicrobiota bacterium]
MKNTGLKTVLSTLVFFGIIYMTLTFTNRSGRMAYLITGLLLFAFGIYSFIKSQQIKGNKFISNLLAITSGIAIWGFIGEFMENANLYIEHSTVKIAHWNFLPILLLMIFIFFQIRKDLKISVQFSLASFLMIWSMHYIMIFQFEVLSRTHFTTYIMCGMFLILTILAIIKTKKSSEINTVMFWSYFGLLTAWTVLEYIWGWRLIPGPYSI